MVVTPVEISGTQPQVGCENPIEAVKEAVAHTTPDPRIASHHLESSLQSLLVLGSSCQVSHLHLRAHTHAETHTLRILGD